MTVFENKLLASLEAGEGDVTVTTEDGMQLLASASILKMCSPVLRAQLSGPMVAESCTLKISMDCEHAAAQAFLRFVYIGRLREEDFQSLEMFSTLVTLADYYGVISEFVAALKQDEPQRLFESMLDSTIGPLEEPSSYITELLIKLRPAISMEKAIAHPVFHRLKLEFGVNVYRYLCHAFAVELPEIRDACREALHSVRLDLGKGVPELESEVSEVIVIEMIKTYPANATIVLQAFLEFMSLCTRISFDHTNTRPAVGDSVILMDGAQGRVVQDDHSQRPFQIITNGETRWLSEDQVKLIKPLPFFEKLSSVIPMVQRLVSNAQDDHRRAKFVVS